MGVAMRGDDEICGKLFSYIDLEERVRADHPLRSIRKIANAALAALSGDFAALYSGRRGEFVPSVPPEKLLRAMLLQAFYSLRSERQLMERIEFDLLFRWFVGIGMDEDPVWDHSSFSKNRDRLLEGEIAAKFLGAVLSRPRVKRLLSSEHFSVDGTLIQAWAAMKSFRPKQPPGDDGGCGGGRNVPADFQPSEALERDASKHDRSRRAALPQGAGHGSKAVLHRPRADGEPLGSARRCPADPGLGACRKAGGARHGAALGRSPVRGVTLRGRPRLRCRRLRRGVACSECPAACGTKNTSGRRSAIDKRTTRHSGYAASLRIRKRIEEAFGWIKGVGGLRRDQLRAAAPRSARPRAAPGDQAADVLVDLVAPLQAVGGPGNIDRPASSPSTRRRSRHCSSPATARATHRSRRRRPGPGTPRAACTVRPVGGRLATRRWRSSRGWPGTELRAASYLDMSMRRPSPVRRRTSMADISANTPKLGATKSVYGPCTGVARRASTRTRCRRPEKAASCVPNPAYPALGPVWPCRQVAR